MAFTVTYRDAALFLAACIAVVGCAPESRRETPADCTAAHPKNAESRQVTLEDLSHTFCEIGTNGVPLGSGFFMSHRFSDARKYYVITADHVYRKVFCPRKTPCFAFPGTNPEYCLRVDFPKDALVIHGRDNCDIVAIDISSHAERLASVGAAFIDFSSAEGYSVAPFCLDRVHMLQMGEFERNGVVLGSRVHAMVTAMGLTSITEDCAINLMIVMSGTVAKMPIAKMKFGPYSGRYLVSDLSVLPGHSGGPVFALMPDGSAAILGIITDKMPSGNGILDQYIFPPGAFVLPFDSLEAHFTQMHLSHGINVSTKEKCLP